MKNPEWLGISEKIQKPYNSKDMKEFVCGNYRGISLLEAVSKFLQNFCSLG